MKVFTVYETKSGKWILLNGKTFEAFEIPRYWVIHFFENALKDAKKLTKYMNGGNE